MIKFKKIRPFVEEMIGFILVIIGIPIILLKFGFIKITFHLHIITISFLILLFSVFIYFYSNIVSIGIRALVDFIFQNTKKEKFFFVDETPFRASVFSEKWEKNHKRSIAMYYFIHLKDNKNTVTFISPTYINMEKGQCYFIEYASSSNIIIDVMKAV